MGKDMKITKKELFKFCDENNDAINELQSQSDSTDFLLAVLIQQLKDSGVIDEISPEPKPQLKQLDQSIFDGLDEGWQFAAVDDDGRSYAFMRKPEIDETDPCFIDGDTTRCKWVGEGYDASNWQNSLIERDIAKELLEVDLSSELTGSELCKAMLARGDKYVSGFGHHQSDDGAVYSTFADTVTRYSHCFHSAQNSWDYFVPINNQGEPLTASEVGL